MGSLDEIELVLVVAEPATPMEGETYEGTGPAVLDECAEKVYRIFDTSRRRYHRNFRSILDLCFPNLDFSQQMRRTWITESYLCSAPHVGGDVTPESERTCARGYLRPQLELLRDRAIVALGGKAKDRIVDTGQFDVLPVHHPSARDQRKARESWRKIPPYLREKRPHARPG
jgi:hypothetical protein